MRAAREPLTFEILDDLVLARERSRAPAVHLEPGPSLGALIELLRFCHEHPGALKYASAPEIHALKRSLETRKPVYLDGERIGFVPARRALHQGNDIHWDAIEVKDASNPISYAPGDPDGATIVEVKVGIEVGDVRIRALLCCPGCDSEPEPPRWCVGGSAMLDYINRCLIPRAPRQRCSTRYPLKLWGGFLAPLVKYVKELPSDQAPSIADLRRSIMSAVP